MDQGILLDGFIQFLGFIAFTAFHEFAHAWVADRCGDDTPRLQGRITLDPLAHIELVGTIILPLALIIFSAASGHTFFFGWGKPVMVNLNNLRVRRRDDILISAAGPLMNLLLAVIMMGGMRLGTMAGLSVLENDSVFNTLLHLIQLNVLLFFFNLLPVPPLDGGHIMRNFLDISDHAYAEISQYSFMFFIIIMRVPGISHVVQLCSLQTTILLGRIFGFHLGISD